MCSALNNYFKQIKNKLDARQLRILFYIELFEFKKRMFVPSEAWSSSNV